MLDILKEVLFKSLIRKKNSGWHTPNDEIKTEGCKFSPVSDVNEECKFSPVSDVNEESWFFWLRLKNALLTISNFCQLRQWISLKLRSHEITILHALADVWLSTDL